MPDIFPRKQSALLGWGANFTGRLPPMVERCGISQQSVVDCIAAFERFRDVMHLRNDPMMSAPPVTKELNNAMAQFKASARPVAGMLRAQPLLSSAELVELGLRPRAQRRKQVAKPADAPSLTVLDCRCGVVELLVRDRDNDSRKARPADTEGVLVLFNKGEKPDAGGWTLLTVSGSTRLRLELPPGIEPGERLWLTAGWLGTRKQSGPFAAPISVHVIPGAIRSRPSLSLAA